MGKKRFITKEGDQTEAAAAAPKKSVKKQVLNGVVHITITYNNTLIAVTDLSGNVIRFRHSSKLRRNSRWENLRYFR